MPNHIWLLAVVAWLIILVASAILVMRKPSTRPGNSPPPKDRTFAPCYYDLDTIDILSSAADGAVGYLCDTHGVVLWEHPAADPPAVVRFDVAEFARHYGYSTAQLPSAIDILDIGYHLRDGSYEPPEPAYRLDVQVLLRESEEVKNGSTRNSETAETRSAGESGPA